MPTFIWTLLLMILFMVGATLSHWFSISVSERITFLSLALLGFYMFYRSLQAKKRFSKSEINADYFDDIGFVVIGLFDGFAIVGLLDMKMPVLIIVTGGILAIFIGRYFVSKIKRRFLSNVFKL